MLIQTVDYQIKNMAPSGLSRHPYPRTADSSGLSSNYNRFVNTKNKTTSGARRSAAAVFDRLIGDASIITQSVRQKSVNWRNKQSIYNNIIVPVFRCEYST